MTDLNTYNFAKELITSGVSKQDFIATVTARGLNTPDAEKLYELLNNVQKEYAMAQVTPQTNTSKTTLGIIILCIGAILFFAFITTQSLFKLRVGVPGSDKTYDVPVKVTGVSIDLSKNGTKDDATVTPIDEDWQTYTNPKYNFSIKVPRSSLVEVVVRRNDSYSIFLNQNLPKEALSSNILRIIIGEDGAKYVDANTRQPKGITTDLVLDGKPFYIWDSSTLVMSERNHLMAQSDGALSGKEKKYYMTIDYGLIKSADLPAARETMKEILESAVFQ
jgi:hypothetical protein